MASHNPEVTPKGKKVVEPTVTGPTPTGGPAENNAQKKKKKTDKADKPRSAAKISLNINASADVRKFVEKHIGTSGVEWADGNVNYSHPFSSAERTVVNALTVRKYSQVHGIDRKPMIMVYKGSPQALRGPYAARGIEAHFSFHPTTAKDMIRLCLNGSVDCQLDALECASTHGPFDVIHLGHNVYTLGPDAICQLVQGGTIVYGAATLFCDTSGNRLESGHIHKGDTAFRRDGGTITLRTKGNHSNYVHPNVDWLSEEGKFISGGVAMTWEIVSVVGDTNIFVFVACPIDLPANTTTLAEVPDTQIVQQAKVRFAYRPLNGSTLSSSANFVRTRSPNVTEATLNASVAAATEPSEAATDVAARFVTKLFNPFSKVHLYNALMAKDLTSRQLARLQVYRQLSAIWAAPGILIAAMVVLFISLRPSDRSSAPGIPNAATMSIWSDFDALIPALIKICLVSPVYEELQKQGMALYLRPWAAGFVFGAIEAYGKLATLAQYGITPLVLVDGALVYQPGFDTYLYAVGLAWMGHVAISGLPIFARMRIHFLYNVVATCLWPFLAPEAPEETLVLEASFPISIISLLTITLLTTLFYFVRTDKARPLGAVEDPEDEMPARQYLDHCAGPMEAHEFSPYVTTTVDWNRAECDGRPNLTRCGPTFAGFRPVIHRLCWHMMLRAVHLRHYTTPNGPTPGDDGELESTMWEYALAKMTNLLNACCIFDTYGNYATWVARYSGAQLARANAEYEETNGYLYTDQLPRLNAFVKKDKVTHITDGVYTPKNPRLIQAFSQEYVNAIGPYCVAVTDALKPFFRSNQVFYPFGEYLEDTPFYILYSSGLDAEDLGAAWQLLLESVATGSTGSSSELAFGFMVQGDDCVLVVGQAGQVAACPGDYHGFDASQTHYSNVVFEYPLCDALGMPKGHDGDRNSYARTRSGVTFEAEAGCGKRKSGSPKTSLLNTLKNISVVLVAIDTRPEDSKLGYATTAEEVATELNARWMMMAGMMGMQLESRVVQPEYVNFCSGYFYPVGRGDDHRLVFGTCLTRFLHKAYWHLGDVTPMQGLRWAKSASLAYKHSMSHIPVAADLVDSVLHQLVAVKAARATHFTEHHHIPRGVVHYDSETIEFVAKLYGTTTDVVVSAAAAASTLDAGRGGPYSVDEIGPLATFLKPPIWAV